MEPEQAYEAWCLDEAVYLWGNLVESEMSKAESSKTVKTAEDRARKRRDALSRMLRDPSATRSAAEFRNPKKALGL